MKSGSRPNLDSYRKVAKHAENKAENDGIQEKWNTGLWDIVRLD